MALTAEQLTRLEQAIRAERERLIRELRAEVERARGESYGAVAGAVTDSADEAVADLLSDLDSAEISRDVREVRELEAAQARLAAGTYGQCADCRADIPFERLLVSPSATRCVACQHTHERTFAHPSEPKL